MAKAVPPFLPEITGSLHSFSQYDRKMSDNEIVEKIVSVRIILTEIRQWCKVKEYKRDSSWCGCYFFD